MADLLDNCRFLAGSMGTADFADGAADPTFRNLEDAGAEDGKTYPYKAQNATGTEWEIGRGMALNTSGGWILERTSIQDSSNGGSLVNFGTAPKVIITAGREEFWAAEDLLSPEATLKGRLAGTGTGVPANLSASQVLGLLGAFSGINLQAFTSNGTYTPTAGMRFCIVIGTGGGGGGGGAQGADATSGNAGGGGSGGATVIDLFTEAQIGASKAVTIGAAGTAGANTGGTGGNGGNTVLDGLLTANGGVGGIGANQGSPDHRTNGTTGATASGGILNIHGGNGGRGAADANSFLFGGDGGGSFWGSGGPGTPSDYGSDNSALPGSDGRAFGTGGSGATCEDNTSGAAGGAGAAGVLFIIEFL